MSATNVPDSNDTSAILRDAYREVPSMMPDGPRCQARAGDDICNAVEPLHRQGLGYIGGHPFVPASPALPEPPKWMQNIAAQFAARRKPPAPALPVEGDDSDRARAEAFAEANYGDRRDFTQRQRENFGLARKVAVAGYLAGRADERRVAEECIAALKAQKDGAYSERNKTVIALAWMALRAGCRVGTREHEGEWDDDWRAILMVDLPTGQASWHFHDSERPLLAGFPAYPDEWDGHTTDEKYERMRALSKPAQEAQDGD